MGEAVYPDWSGLPEDLMATVMRNLDIPDLFHAGTACKSWYGAYSAVRRVRIPIKDASPCLLYSCADDDADIATLYSPSAGEAFKVRLPAPAFRSRQVVGSGHGWVVTADEASNLQAVNPLTGAQVDLPPVTGLYNVEASSDEEGRLVYHIYDELPNPDTPGVYTAEELRTYLYHRVYLSCSPSAGGCDCVILLVHMQHGKISFARLGDDRWTLVTNRNKETNRNETVPDHDYTSATYNKNDRTWYVLSLDSSIYAFDLNGSSPIVRMISRKVALWGTPNSYIVLAPWGDILHVWRDTAYRASTTAGQVPLKYEDHEDELIIESYFDSTVESYTYEMELYKVDINDQKLVKINSFDLQGHALFLGFNSTMMLSTKTFPGLKPNSAYLTDDNWETICINMSGCRDVGIWNFGTETLESLVNVDFAHTWLNWPSPIWITPSLS